MSGDSKDEGELQNYFDDLLDPGAGMPMPEYAEPEEPTPAYAEPEDEHRERLQKLLSSAAPRPQPAEEVTPQAIPTPAPEPTPKPEPQSEPPQPEQTEKTESPAPERQESEPLTTPEPVVETPTPVESAPVEPAPAEAVPVESTASEEAETAEPAAEDFAFQARDLEWLENGRPPWAQQRFDALLFTVSGLTLAVPLISLGQIQRLDEELTPLAGHAEWFMGIQPTPTGRIRTVNTAKFVMPERYDDAFEKNARYVISIDGVPWGLAVDSVKEPVSLDPSDVKWRTERGKRPWLAGTVKEHMCALLDVPRIGQLLMEAQTDKKR